MLLWPAEIAEEPPTDLVIHTGKGRSKGLAAGGNVSLSLPPLEKLCMALKAAAGDTLATAEDTEDVMALTDVTENTAESSTDLCNSSKSISKNGTL